MKINCYTETQWHAAIAAMVREGCTFNAYHEPAGVDTCRAEVWIVELTGGY